MVYESGTRGAPPNLFGAVLLDTNVLYPVALRDLLLRLAEQRLYEPRWSARILEELRRNLVADGRSDETRAQRMLGLIRQTFPDAEIDPPQALIERMTNVPEDRHVLAAAVAARAGFLVTMNLKDFPGFALEPFGVEALSPDAFLHELLNAAPTTIVETLSTQASVLTNPPKTFDAVLDELSVQVPAFVSRVRATIPA